METGSDKGGVAGGSTRPYLIRALHEWCTDNGLTPYVAVHVDSLVQVPMEYVSNNEIVLNVGLDATSGLDLGNDFIQFKARFGGVAREITVPVDHVVAIYARENGQGMAFPAPEGQAPSLVTSAPAARPSTVRRGLRLASSPSSADGTSVSDLGRVGGTRTPTNDADAPPDDDSPTDTPPGSGRPSLKRVK